MEQDFSLRSLFNYLLHKYFNWRNALGCLANSVAFGCWLLRSISPNYVAGRSSGKRWIEFIALCSFQTLAPPAEWQFVAIANYVD